MSSRILCLASFVLKGPSLVCCRLTQRQPFSMVQFNKILQYKMLWWKRVCGTIFFVFSIKNVSPLLSLCEATHTMFIQQWGFKLLPARSAISKMFHRDCIYACSSQYWGYYLKVYHIYCIFKSIFTTIISIIVL